MPRKGPERFALYVDIVSGGSKLKARGKLPSYRRFNVSLIMDDREDVCRCALEDLAIVPYQVHTPPYDIFDPTSFEFGSNWLTLCRMHHGERWPRRARPQHVAQRGFMGALRAILDERVNGQLEAKLETADGLLRREYRVERGRNAISAHPAPPQRLPAGAR